MPDFSRVAAVISPQGRLRRAWDLAGGMSAEMSVLEIETPDDCLTRYVLRRPSEAQLRENPAAVVNEHRVLQVGQALGLPMPAPVMYVPEGDGIPAPCLVMEYIEGRMDFAPADLPEYLRQMAAALAQIHATTLNGDALSFLPRREDACGETKSPEDLPADLPAESILAALRACLPPIPSNPPALLHGDYWPGNLLWQNDRLAVVVDWEDAALGDPLIDLAVARLEAVWMFGPPALPLFTQPYTALLPLDCAALPYWDLCAALRLSRMVGSNLADWAAYFVPYGRGDLTPPLLVERFAWFAAQAAEIVSVF